MAMEFIRFIMHGNRADHTSHSVEQTILKT